MKKIFSLMALLIAATTFAGQENMRLTFKTTGPDTYGDGKTVVLDGEFYAIIWTPANSTFSGFNANGELVANSDEILATVPFAKGGCLPLTKLEIEGSETERAKYAAGSFTLAILDTRLADGTLSAPVVGEDELSKPARVNGYVAVAEMSVEAAAASAALDIDSPIKLEFTKSLVDAAESKPQITALRREGDYMVITVKGTKAYLQYNVAKGETPEAIGEAGEAAPVDGKATTEETIEIRVKVDPNATSGFFKVIRN